MPRLPPVEKLSLAVRKNYRDAFEANRPDLEKALSELLGTEWTIDIKPNEIFPYAAQDPSAVQSFGYYIESYVSGAIFQLRCYADNFGDEGKAELNTICKAHVLTLDAGLGDEEDASGKPRFNYCGCEVTKEDGRLCMVFNPKNFGVNAGDAVASRVLCDALNGADGAAGSPPLSFLARTGIRQDFDPAIEQHRWKIADMLDRPDLKVSADFPGIFAALLAESRTRKTGLDPDWQRGVGRIALDYFNSLQFQMDCQKFGDDDLLQEGFAEAVTKGEIVLRVVDKLQYDSYCESVIEDSVLYIQTTTKTWGVNTSNVASKLIDQL